MGVFTQRYGDTINGAITFTGNTCGLSKEKDTNNAGQEHSIGAFISTDTGLNYPTYATTGSIPPNNNSGSTIVVAENGSFAFLNLPTNSTILYADLIWGGSYKVGGQDRENQINNPIVFTVGAGIPITINPTNNVTPIPTVATLYKVPGGASYYFWIKEVTSVLTALTSGSTRISCEQILGTTEPLSNADNACGWTLCVVYQNGSLPSRNITLFSGNETTFVASNNTVESTVTGFETPPTGQVNGRILFTALEGDAVLTGDRASITNSSNVYNDLFGPRNPVNNFFDSQINDDAGNTDTTGSFGLYNQAPITGDNIDGGRQGWDITNVNANPAPFVNLDNGQTSTNVRCTSSGDRYWVTGVALQLDVNAPIIETRKEVDKTTAVVNEILEYTVTIKNTGTAIASNVVIDDDIPPFTVYEPNTATVSGAVGDFSLWPTKVTLLTPISIGATVTFKYKVIVTGVPPQRTIINFTDINYTFLGPDQQVISGFAQTNSVTTSLTAPLPPVVPNYTVETCKNGSVSGTVVGIDIDGHYPLTYSIFTPPTNGFANISPTTGEWLYTPKVGFVGADSFVIQVLDSENAASYSAITIKVLDISCVEFNCLKCRCSN